jgi:carbonic anhydrase/acetyltransferase-like protein (isoleucine patch superfamily)
LEQWHQFRIKMASSKLFARRPDGSYIAHNATVVGQVSAGAQSSFWFNAVVRGDVAPITIGARVNVQDHVVIHCDTDVPNVIEDDVSMGHGAIVHGTFVGAGSLVGMNATVLGQTRIGRQCLIAAGAVVPPRMEVPDRMLAAGVPARIIRPITSKELEYLQWLPGRYVSLASEYLAKQT